MNYLLFILFISFSTLCANEPLDWLTTKKTDIINQKGERITLKGVNLGGWLQQEMWMLPFVLDPSSKSDFTAIQDHVSLWKMFESRFGTKKMHEIRTHYRNTWIQDIDFANIKAAGFNAVRLPFLFDLASEPEGLFYWLDYAISLAQQNNLYVILDLHGAPGRQSPHEHTGEVSINQFFSSQANITKACEIWKELARRYKDCSTIAGYDILNEPAGASSNRELYAVSDKLYKAIRSEDTKHIIIIEDGYKGVSNMANPKDFKWQNVVISTHFYMFEDNTTEEFIKKFNDHLKNVEEKQKKIQVPYYLGEFNVAPRGSFETMTKVMSTLRNKKISYSFWTYKIGRRGHQNSMWGIYHASANQKNIDPYKDSYKDVMKKTDRLASKNYAKNSDLIKLFKE